MVYEHFFAPDSSQPEGYHLDSTPPAYATSEIVGHDFCSEVIEWYYEHGCAGHPILLQNLDDFLVRDLHGLGVTPERCTMRSLEVKVDGTRPYGTLIPLEAPYEEGTTEDGFVDLLVLNLKKGFRLNLPSPPTSHSSATSTSPICLRYLTKLRQL
jgi:hypothetical protein